MLDVLRLTANSPDVGEAQESMDVIYQGPAMQIAFNPEFLQAPLRALDHREQAVRGAPVFDDPLKGAEARYDAGDTSLAEILPVRRDWAAIQLTYLESLRDVMQAWVEIKPLAQR